MMMFARSEASVTTGIQQAPGRHNIDLFLGWTCIWLETAVITQQVSVKGIKGENQTQT